MSSPGYLQKLRLFRKEHGICTQCTEKAETGFFMCQKHRDLFNARSREKKLVWIEKGICRTCGVRKVGRNFVSCKVCRANRLEQYHKEIEENPLFFKKRYAAAKEKSLRTHRCHRCGGPLREEDYIECTNCSLARRGEFPQNRRIGEYEAINKSITCGS